MGQDPGAIRQDIERTRGEMGDTVEALGYKADVPSRARDKVGAMKSKVTGAMPDVGGAMPDRGQVSGGARRMAGTAQENPLGLAIGAAAVGFVAGMAMPSTRMEDERLGPMAEQVRETVRETGQEAVERGRDVAQQAMESAKETARDAGQQEASEMGGSVQEKAEQVREHMGAPGASGSGGQQA